MLSKWVADIHSLDFETGPETSSVTAVNTQVIPNHSCQSVDCLILFRMSMTNIIIEIDAEIARLQQARNLLAGSEKSTESKKDVPVRKRRKMSEEARARIAEAQRKRWAAQSVDIGRLSFS
jgi:hypothetical protein